MSANLQNLLRDALLNNSYDYSSLHKALKTTWMNSFSYLYTQQKAYVEYEELFYYSNDTVSRNSKRIGHLYVDKLIRACFDVDYDLIHVCNREEYYTSRFYQEEISVNDIVYNPNIFLKIPIIMIDDKVIWDYKVKLTKDCLHVILPFKRQFVIDDNRNPSTGDIVYVDHKIQVLIVDNNFYQRFTLNKSSMSYSATNKTISISKATITSLTNNNVTSDTNKDVMKIYGVNSVSQFTPEMVAFRDKEYAKRIKNLAVPTQKGIMMCSIHIPNSAGRGYELGTAMIPMEFNSSTNYFVATLSDDLVNLLNNTNVNVYVSLCYINRLYHHKFYNNSYYTTATSSGADLLVVQEANMKPYKMPVPVEDFMVFKNHNNKGFILEKNTDMLEMHYPNIYRIKDTTQVANDVYNIYYFYHEADDLKYTVLFDFYFTFLSSLYNGQAIEKIINDVYYNRNNLSGYTDAEKAKFREVFNKIFAYQYAVYNYGESDFLNRYKVIPANADKEPIEYKDETYKEWLRIDQWALRDYVLEQDKLGSSYHLFTNTINLNSRKRRNTATEIPNSGTTFDEDRYVFAFNNNKLFPALLDCRIFVDGILVIDLYQERYLYMDYFYIPASMVTADSYIEIEIFPEYTISKDIKFTSMNDEKTVTLFLPKTEPYYDVEDTFFVTNNKYAEHTFDEKGLSGRYVNDNEYWVEGDSSHVDLMNKPKDIYPTIPDVYFQNDDSIQRFTPSDFNITAVYKRGTFEYKTTDSKKPVEFTRINQFKIKPKNSNVVNKNLTFKINKKSYTVSFVVTRSGFLKIEIPQNDFIFSEDYMRVYRNGRLLPHAKLVYQQVYDKIHLTIRDYAMVGDFIYIDITPYRYKEIYYQESLSPDNTLIDLRGIITKPFDIRYYDVYLNGRKLSLNNVFAIAPWSITLVNLKSIYNLTIYERERDWEYFGLDYTQNIYYYSITDLFEDGIVKEDTKNKMIKDIIDGLKDDRLNIYPNTNDEENEGYQPVPIIYSEMNIYYVDDLVPHTYYDPDVVQDDSTIVHAFFPNVESIYKHAPYDSTDTSAERSRRSSHPYVMNLDPDIYIQEKQDSEAILVHVIGHSNEISQEFLNQSSSITIPDEGNIDQ